MPREGSVEQKWTVVRNAMVESAVNSLQVEKRHHPDWFKENAQALKPVLQRHNLLYTKWLSSRRHEDLIQFR